MTNDVQIYSNCMEDLLPRMQLIQSIVSRGFTTANALLDSEIVFLQFRKMLEQIAFASLAANKDAYAAAREKFANEWRATKMLKYLESVNPKFYPQPLRVTSTVRESGRNHHHLQPLVDGYLTKEEFVELYDHCADVLHARNPYSGASSVIDVGRSAQDWLFRIKKLVELHRAELITGACWIGAVPDKDGRVHTYTAEPSAANTATL